MRIIIIGTGLAGQLVLQNIRQQDNDSEVVMLSAHGGEFYIKPSLSGVFTQGKKPEDLVQQSKEAVERQYDCDIQAYTKVHAIDRERKTVQTDKEIYAYDKLVLALGADPITLPGLPDSDRIFRVNHLDDYKRFHKKLNKTVDLGIIGGGLIGVEFAYDTAEACRSVTVVEQGETLMSSMLPKEIGQYIATGLEKKSVTVLTSTSVSRVVQKDNGIVLKFPDGEKCFDLLLVVIGIRPNTELAKVAGLVTNRGIVVDKYGRTSDPDIYALGDCAEVCGLVKCFIAPLRVCAQAVAMNVLGDVAEIVYEPMPVSLKTPDIPVGFCYAECPSSWVVEKTEKGVKALSYKDDVLQGFALSGDYVKERLALKKKMKNWF